MGLSTIGTKTALFVFGSESVYELANAANPTAHSAAMRSDFHRTAAVSAAGVVTVVRPASPCQRHNAASVCAIIAKLRSAT